MTLDESVIVCRSITDDRVPTPSERVRRGENGPRPYIGRPIHNCPVRTSLHRGQGAAFDASSDSTQILPIC